MYFSLTPNLRYDAKPISYPFSESDLITTKNFFRRYQVDPDVFDYAVFYNKYSVGEGERIETVAQKAYGDPLYDWVLILTNNYVNPLFAFPLDNNTLRKVVEEKYGDEAYSGVHHYVTESYLSDHMVDGKFVEVLKGGLIVDKAFYDKPFTYWSGNQYITVPGSNVSSPVSNYEHEVAENEKKREMFILKDKFLSKFVNEFKTRNLYGKSSDFITKRLKKVAV